MIKGIVKIYRICVFYTALSLFGFGSLFYNGFCLILSILPGNSRRLCFHQRLGAKLLRFYFWLIQKAGLCRIELPNCENLQLRQPSIVIANHTGLMDAIILNTLFPESACVFKSGLTRNPCFSHILRCGEHLSNDEGIDMIRKGVEIARSGRAVVVFPEGTRNRESSKLSFKKGFALMAKRAEVPVALFSITNPSHAFSKEMGIYKVPELPFTLKFEFITQVDFELNESIDRFVNRIEAIYHRKFSSVHASTATETLAS